MIVMGVDPSLTSTGVAFVDTAHGEWFTLRVRTSPSGGGISDTAERMRLIAERVVQEAVDVLEQEEQGCLVVIEGLAVYGRNSNAGLLAGLWWQIVSRFVGMNLRVQQVAPAARAKYATGNGRASKSDVLAAVRDAHPAADVANHDIADAVALAALGARRLGEPVEARDRPWFGEVAAGIRW